MISPRDPAPFYPGASEWAHVVVAPISSPGRAKHGGAALGHGTRPGLFQVEQNRVRLGPFHVERRSRVARGLR